MPECIRNKGDSGEKRRSAKLHVIEIKRVNSNVDGPIRHRKNIRKMKALPRTSLKTKQDRKLTWPKFTSSQNVYDKYSTYAREARMLLKGKEKGADGNCEF